MKDRKAPNKRLVLKDSIALDYVRQRVAEEAATLFDYALSARNYALREIGGKVWIIFDPPLVVTGEELLEEAYYYEFLPHLDRKEEG